VPARIAFNPNGSYSASGSIWQGSEMGSFWIATTGTDRKRLELDVSRIAGGVPFTVEQDGAFIIAGSETDDIVSFDITISEGVKASIAVDVLNGERREIMIEGRS
jgi:hypothetical protein